MHPTTYEIVLRGHVGERLAPEFEQLALELRPGRTVMRGELIDQAELYGVIERLRDLGIDLVSVNAGR